MTRSEINSMNEEKRNSQDQPRQVKISRRLRQRSTFAFLSFRLLFRSAPLSIPHATHQRTTCICRRRALKVKKQRTTVRGVGVAAGAVAFRGMMWMTGRSGRMSRGRAVQSGPAPKFTLADVRRRCFALVSPVSSVMEGVVVLRTGWLVCVIGCVRGRGCSLDDPRREDRGSTLVIFPT
jgi:hypothetical protein